MRIKLRGFVIEKTRSNAVCLAVEDLNTCLTPSQARELGEALIEIAADADQRLETAIAWAT